MTFLRRELPELYLDRKEGNDSAASADAGEFPVKKTSIFGEAEADLARW